MSDYSIDYAQRRTTVGLLTGQDKKGVTHFVRNAPVILNVNNDRLTTITLLDCTGGRAVARFDRKDVLVKDDPRLIVANLLAGHRLSHLEDGLRLV
jgi:hypothetical protein